MSSDWMGTVLGGRGRTEPGKMGEGHPYSGWKTEAVTDIGTDKQVRQHDRYWASTVHCPFPSDCAPIRVLPECNMEAGNRTVCF